MPRTPSNEPPKYRRHKPSNRAVVTLNGRDYYLGPFNSPESRRAYDERIAEWLANGRRPPGQGDVTAPDQLAATGPDPDALTITELLALYFDHAVEYYPKRGELQNMKDVMDSLERRFGPLPAVDFGPLALCELRQAWIEGTYRPATSKRRPPKKLARKVINARVNRVRRIFRWAVARQLIPPATWEALRAVDPLKRGRCQARETEPVHPVTEGTVNATLPFLPWPVADMVLLQLHTGMRPQEVVGLRTGDLDTSGRVWVYTPATHKTAHHGHTRTILIGPRAQAILRPYLKPDLAAPVFNPAEALERRLAERRAARKTPMTPSQRARRRKQRPRKTPGTCYSSSSYGRAIAAACRRHNLDHWHPHQLRHTAATKLRKEAGVELAQIVLGHHSLKATEVYAEADLQRAAAVIFKVG